MSVNRNNVRMVRLLTGEEIIGEVIPVNVSKFLQESAGGVYQENKLDVSGDITLRLPFLVVPQMKGQQVSLGFVPWIVYKHGENVTIRANSIVSIVEIDDSLVNNYANAHSSVLVPDNKIARV